MEGRHCLLGWGTRRSPGPSRESSVGKGLQAGCRGLMRGCGVGKWSGENRRRGWSQAPGDATLRKTEDAPPRQDQRRLAEGAVDVGVPAVGFSFLCEGTVGTPGH